MLLHAAIVVMMAFLAMQPRETVAQPPFNANAVIVTQNTLKGVEKRPDANRVNANTSEVDKKRPRMDAVSQSFGNNRANGTSFYTFDPKNLVADAGNGHTGNRLNVIGTGGGGDRLGGVEGFGPTGRGFFNPTGPRIEVEGRKIVYIVDRSGSMTDSIDYVKAELRRSIDDLDENTQFHVIFYSSGAPVEMPSRRLVAATDRNKEMAYEFIDNIVASGETDPSKAIERAFAVGADLVYLLTDGEFDKQIVPLVKRLNPTGKTTVNTICFLYKDPELDVGTTILKRIAAENGGQYQFIGEADLAGLSN
jgi:hypothetical protein